MLNATIKSLLAHRLRLALSAVAVVLGVAFVAGSFVFTDTIDKTFTELFEGTGSDVTVTPRPAFSADTFAGPGMPGAVETVPASVVEEIASVDGVAAAVGEIQVDGVRVVGADGATVGTAGAPVFGVNWTDGESPLSIVAGREPRREGEVAVDRVAAAKGRLAVGDTVTLVMPQGPPIEAELVGTMSFGSSGNLAGATLTAFDDETAQRLLTAPGEFTRVAVDAADGVDNDVLAERVLAALGDDYEVRTWQDLAAEGAAMLAEGLGFLNTLLLAFAGVALFVGSFIILNTFSMIVAQRTRELALLRAVGASRRQVTGSVLVEALLVGVVGSVLGMAGGLGVAKLLQVAFAQAGMEISTGGLVFGPRTAAVSLAVGLVVTVVAAFFPARRASAIPPVAAMRDDVALGAGPVRRRAVVGAVLVAGGGAALAAAVRSDGGAAGVWLGVGALAVLVGVIAASPAVSRPVVALLGLPVRRLRGTVGRLSVSNAVRNPRRTSATASALMVGLALVSAFAVLASSVNASIDRLVDSALGGTDFLVSDATAQGFSPQVAEDLGDLDEVATVVRQRGGAVQLDGVVEPAMNAVDPEGLREVLSVDFVSGSADGLRDGLIVDRELARSRGWSVGDMVEVTSLGGAEQLPVSGVYERSEALGPAAVSVSTWERLGGGRSDQFLYVQLADGVDAETARDAVDGVVAAYPQLTVNDQTEFKEQQRSQVNQILFLVYALLGLAILIAVLGIVNTLALSVIERTREIGLLRAVGMGRAQLRAMVRWESVVIAVYGAVLGLGLGLLLGTVMQRVLAAEGVEVLSVPYPSMLAFLALAGVVGVLAAVWPARRAARLDVLRAITTE